MLDARRVKSYYYLARILVLRLSDSMSTLNFRHFEVVADFF